MNSHAVHANGTNATPDDKTDDTFRFKRLLATRDVIYTRVCTKRAYPAEEIWIVFECTTRANWLRPVKITNGRISRIISSTIMTTNLFLFRRNATGRVASFVLYAFGRRRSFNRCTYTGKKMNRRCTEVERIIVAYKGRINNDAR